MTTIVLTPMSVGFSQLEQVYRGGISPQLDPICKAAVELAASRIAEAAAGGAPVYGVNTGFGKLASVKVAAEDTAQAAALVGTGAVTRAAATELPTLG